MFQNLKYSESIERTAKITFVSISLIFVSGISYSVGNYIGNVRFLSLVLAIIGLIIFVPCLLWLVKRREDPGAKHVIKISILGFIIAMMYYIISI